jgi:hypothetical protein
VFKRAFWFGSGVVVGAGGTVWATVQLRRAAAQVTPGGLADQALTHARRVGGDLRDAVAEGRLVMRETEAELRRDLTPPALPPGSSSAIDVLAVEGRGVEPERVERRRPGTPGRRLVARR